MAAAALGVAVAAFLYHQLVVKDLIAVQQRSNVVFAAAVVGAALSPQASILTAPAASVSEDVGRRPDVVGLNAAVRSALRGTDIVRLDILTPSGVVVYSTASSQIGTSRRDDPMFQRALLDETPSVLRSLDKVEGLDRRLEREVEVVSTYVPYRGADRASSAVLEVHADVGALAAQARAREWMVLAAFGVALGLLAWGGRWLMRDAGMRQREVEREAGERRVRHQAFHDALTGLPNRANFLEYLGEAVARADRDKSRLAVFMIDIDRFKLVNESYGHKIGDQLLRRVARRVKSVMPRDEKLFRVGGDEFACVLAGDDPARNAAVFGQRVIAALSGTFQVDERAISVAVSIGVTVCPDDAPDAAGLARHADAALFNAKAEGGGRVVFFAREMSERAGRRLELEAGLRRALKDSEFDIYYQPRYDALDRRVVAVEALLRWRSSTDGKFITPDEFVPVLEDTGLIGPVGRWVLQRAARQAREWQVKGWAPVRMSVNVSPRQFHSNDFVETVRMALRTSELAPQWLELELTERMLCEDTEQAVAKMQALVRMGVVLSIDDFGTGYSSLAYLQRFPINYLKIDKSFVRGITKGKRDAAIALAIIDMAHNLQIGLVAEGVELEDQAAILRERGCHELQGFLFSRPLPAAQVELRLKAANGPPQTEGVASDFASRVIVTAAQRSAARAAPPSFEPTTFSETVQDRALLR